MVALLLGVSKLRHDQLLGEGLYKHVIQTPQDWGKNDGVQFVSVNYMWK